MRVILVGLSSSDLILNLMLLCLRVIFSCGRCVECCADCSIHCRLRPSFVQAHDGSLPRTANWVVPEITLSVLHHLHSHKMQCKWSRFMIKSKLLVQVSSLESFKNCFIALTSQNTSAACAYFIHSSLANLRPGRTIRQNTPARKVLKSHFIHAVIIAAGCLNSEVLL